MRSESLVRMPVPGSPMTSVFVLNDIIDNNLITKHILSPSPN